MDIVKQKDVLRVDIVNEYRKILNQLYRGYKEDLSPLIIKIITYNDLEFTI